MQLPTKIKAKAILSLRNQLQMEMQKGKQVEIGKEKIPMESHNAFTGKAVSERP